MATRKQNEQKKCQYLIDRYKELESRSPETYSEEMTRASKTLIYTTLVKRHGVPLQDLYRIVSYIELTHSDPNVDKSRLFLSNILREPFRFVFTAPFAIRYEIAKGIQEHQQEAAHDARDMHSAWLYDYLVHRERTLYVPKSLFTAAFTREFGYPPPDDVAISMQTFVTHPSIKDTELVVGEILMNAACEDEAAEDVDAEDVDAEVRAYALSRGIRLTSKQHCAVMHALKRHVTFVCGHPGTGKSTIVESVLHHKVDRCRRSVVVMAPTGMAVNNLIANTVERDTVTYATMHKMAYGGFYKMLSKGAPVHDVIIDEFSMVDFQLFTDVVRWCERFECSLLILADENQLPPIGAGNVLRTILRSGHMPVFRLKRIMRQGAGALRNMVLAMSKLESVRFDAFDQESLCIENTAVFDEAVVRDVVLRHGLTASNSRFITPQHKHAEGTISMNRILQKVYGGNGAAATPSFKTEYRVNIGDLVVRNTNDYRADTLVANGDVGIVRKGSKLGFYRVEYERKGNAEEVFVDDLYTDFSLAYCTTVHKAQGSQFDYVVVIMGNNHDFSWRSSADARSLLYTAVSRARKRCLILGDPRLFRHAQAIPQHAQRPCAIGTFMSEFTSDWN